MNQSRKVQRALSHEPWDYLECSSLTRTKCVLQLRNSDNVSIRKDAQAALCANLLSGRWKGSKLKRQSGEEIRIRVQKPRFQRRRDRRLTDYQEAVMAQNHSTNWKDNPIDWSTRAVCDAAKGAVFGKQKQFGAWVVKDE